MSSGQVGEAILTRSGLHADEHMLALSCTLVVLNSCKASEPAVSYPRAKTERTSSSIINRR